MEWSSGEKRKRRGAYTRKGILMAKDYLVEDVAGIEREAGSRKSHVLEAYVGDGPTWDASGTQFRPTG